MDTHDMEKYKKILEDKKKELITELLRENEDYSDLSEESMGDLVDQAYKLAERDLIFGMSQNEKATLQMISAALERIEAGTFGACAACGERIEDKRLEIMPYAIKCVKCKTLEEKELIHQPVRSGTETLQLYISDEGMSSDNDDAPEINLADSLE